jgi:acyl carrier protein
MQRSEIVNLLQDILKRQGKTVAVREEVTLQEIGFRSLDFSELALRFETASGSSLTFDAAPLRAIRTVGDVLDFFEKASAKD